MFMCEFHALIQGQNKNRDANIKFNLKLISLFTHCIQFLYDRWYIFLKCQIYIPYILDKQVSQLFKFKIQPSLKPDIKEKMMLAQCRKKSSSLPYTSINQRTTKIPTRKNNLSNCRSVSAFNQNPNNANTNRSNEIEKFSIQNKSTYNNNCLRRNFQPSKINSTNNVYKQAIERRKKSTAKKGLHEELLATIDTFQEALCSLPLDKLILSQNPYQWTEQQVRTLQKLQQKFTKIQSTLKLETRQYYNSKIQNVTVVLKNIGQNLQTLNRMSLLKKYTSEGTSIHSRNSHSSSSLVTTPNANNQQNIHFNKYKTSQGRNYATQYENSSNRDEGFQNDNKQNNTRLSNQEIRKSQPTNYALNCQKVFRKAQITEKDSFVLGEYKSSASQNRNTIDNCQTLRSQKSQTENGDSYQHNYQMMGYGNLTLFRKDKSVINNQQVELLSKNKNMNRTVSKYHQKGSKDKEQTNDLKQSSKHPTSHQQSKQTLNTLGNSNQDSLQQSSQLLCEQTKRRNWQSQSNQLYTHKIQQLLQQISIKNKILTQLQNKAQKKLSLLQQQFSKKQRHYLSTIYEFKQQLQSKQQSIKQLLLQNQAKNDRLQLLQKALNQTKNGSKQCKERNVILDKSLEKLSGEIRLARIREEQLRETVRLQRQRTNKVKQHLEGLEDQQSQLVGKINLMTQQNNSLVAQKTQLQDRVQVLTNQHSKQGQKQQIYKLKYFRLNAQFEKFKEKVTQDAQYWRKICINCKKHYTNRQDNDNQKHIELKQLIQFHKKRLLS